MQHAFVPHSYTATRKQSIHSRWKSDEFLLVDTWQRATPLTPHLWLISYARKSEVWWLGRCSLGKRKKKATGSFLVINRAEASIAQPSYSEHMLPTSIWGWNSGASSLMHQQNLSKRVFRDQSGPTYFTFGDFPCSETSVEAESPALACSRNRGLWTPLRNRYVR